jgi:hypothetical protein
MKIILEDVIMKIAIDIGDGKSCETCDFLGAEIVVKGHVMTTVKSCRVFRKFVRIKEWTPRRLAECVAAEREPGAPC